MAPADRSLFGQDRKGDPAKVAISVDMEGISGVAGADETEFGKDEYNAARKWMLSDVNACVEGACDGGATYVQIHDTHGGNKRNLPYGELDPRAYLVKGGNLFFWNYDALDSSFGAAMLIGMHAGPLQQGVLAHYFTEQMREIRFNGLPVTESHVTIGLAAALGIPTVLVSGDDRVCDAIRDWSHGQIETVVTKHALGWNSAIMAPLSETHARIRAAANESLKKAPSTPLLRFKEPVEVAMELSIPEQAQYIAMIPTVRRVGERGVAFTADTILAAHKLLIVALMILASPIGPPVLE
jgi:D-amino peptidase